NFSPHYVNLNNFDAVFGKSDLHMSGSIVDFLPYILSDGTIKGDFKFNSQLLDLNEMLSEDTVATQAETDTAALTVFEVPANVDFILTSSIKQLKYDNLDINNVRGTIEIKDQQVLMNNLRMYLLEGSMVMNGAYSTVDISKPTANFDLAINKFDIPAAFDAFTTVQKFVPIAKNATGRFSSNLTFQSQLGSDMMPVLSSINASGDLTSDQVAIKQSATFSKLSDALKTDKFKTITINDLDLSFEIKDGRISVSPFETHIGNTDLIIAGDQGLDQTMNFIISMNIPRSALGGGANQLISDLTSKASAKGLDINPGQTISLDALVGGTVTDPKVSLNMKESLGSAKEMVKQQVTEQVKQKAEEVKTEAKQKASAEAQKIISQAEQEAEKIREAATKAANAVRQEANTNADRIIKEAEGKPKFARDIAKKAADKVRKEGEDKADKIVEEANQKADSVIQKAKDQAAKLDD
ncbi:MAG TPA: AsmA-like C-terminal region-containing protein, partial [Bacteroidales bacterium]|nr:AsmA-like C-terminal region-containing protein [Bacteroidales bacterium]